MKPHLKQMMEKERGKESGKEKENERKGREKVVEGNVVGKRREGKGSAVALPPHLVTCIILL